MPQLSSISRWFDPFRLEPKDVTLGDLATSLSNICRFNGHVTRFYSVAQHSMAVARLVEARGYGMRASMQALLHDAAEAYGIGDIPGPLKGYICITGFYSPNCRASEFEAKLLGTIHAGLGCPAPSNVYDACVKQADLDMLVTECIELKPSDLILFDPPNVGIRCLQAETIGLVEPDGSTIHDAFHIQFNRYYLELAALGELEQDDAADEDDC